jgi:hypothetical protein
MSKKQKICILTALVLVFSFFPALALPHVSVCADAGMAQDVFISKTSFQASLYAGFSLSEQFQLRVPLNFTFTTRGKLMFDAGLLLTAYPFEDLGFFAGMTIVQFGTHKGKLYALNEVVAGWTFRIRYSFIIEPSVSFRDPSSTFTNEYSTVRGIFPCYTQIRVHLMMGWQII